MPYMTICRAVPDDEKWHDPVYCKGACSLTGKTKCGKDCGERVREGVQADGRTIVSHRRQDACLDCFPFMKKP